MNLISCEQCGVVFDKDKIIFPDAYDPDTQDLILENVAWDVDDYVPMINCPVCSGIILKTC